MCGLQTGGCADLVIGQEAKENYIFTQSPQRKQAQRRKNTTQFSLSVSPCELRLSVGLAVQNKKQLLSGKLLFSLVLVFIKILSSSLPLSA
jgi:hypothetical protein